MEVRLRANRYAILKDLEPSKYWNYLYQEGVFDEDDVDEVKSERTRKKRAETFLEKVQRKGPIRIAVFVNELSRIQPHLYELLQREPLVHVPAEQLLPRHGQEGSAQGIIGDVTQGMTGLHMFEQSAPFARKALSPVEQGSDDKPSDQLGNKEAGELPEHQLNHETVPPADEMPLVVIPTDLNKLPAHIGPDCEEVYPMRSKPRGIALIINNEFFVPSTEQTQKEQEKEQLDNRLGSDKDVTALQNLFVALDFKVKTERNIGREKIHKVLDDIANDDHRAYDCFVLCLMSHGKEGLFYGADGGTVQIETVCDFFSNSNSGTLKGKPKLIIIQACRGLQKEKGVARDSPNSPEPLMSTVVTGDNGDNGGEVEEVADQGFNFSLPTIIPDHADILLAYSTVSGYASFRNPRDGSRFVRCLVEVFQEKAGHEDVLSMLTMVNDSIGKMGEIGTKQVGQPTSTLTKKLFFWPGL